MTWQPIETAPLDQEILGWVVADADDVQIYSSRSSQSGGVEAMRDALCRWEQEHFDGLAPGCIVPLLSFPVSKPAAFLTIDDRAVCFEGDFSAIDAAELAAFKPWNKRPAADVATSARDV